MVFTTCQLDGGTATACTSPKNYAGLALGEHSLTVAATDEAGRTGSSTVDFTVESSLDTVFTGGVGEGATVDDSGATLEFSATGAASYECKIDADTWFACRSPWETSFLANGAHSLFVRAVDAFGNREDDPAQRTITVAAAIQSLSPDETDPGAVARYKIPISSTLSLGVDLKSGNLNVAQLDRLDASEPDFAGFERYYNSIPTDLTETGLGPNWSLGVGPNIYLVVMDTHVEVRGPGGYFASFVKKASGEFDGPPLMAASLTKAQNGNYELSRWAQKDSLRFSSEGVLLSVRSQQGHTYSVSSAESGQQRVLSVIGGSAFVSASLNLDGRISTLSYNNGAQSDDLVYNSQGNLAEHQGSLGTSEYSYSSHGYLTGVTAVDGTTITIQPSSSGRTEAIVVNRPGQAASSYQFTFGPESTQVTNPSNVTNEYPWFPDGTSAETPEARDDQIQSIIDDEGKTKTEANAELAIQEKTIGLDDALESALGTGFISLSYAETDGRTKVLVSNSTAATQAANVIDSFGATQVVDVAVTSETEASLDAAQGELETALATLMDAGKVTVAQDTGKMHLMLEVASGLSQAESAEVSAAVAGSDVGVDITESADDDLTAVPASQSVCKSFPPSGDLPARSVACNRPLRGGMTISWLGGVCTAGFNARKPSGQQVLITAGHCVKDDVFFDAEYLRPSGSRLSKLLGTRGAYQWGMRTTGNNSDAGSIIVGRDSFWHGLVSPWVAYVGSNGYNYRYVIAGRGTNRLGQKVCVAGAVSGQRCGKVKAINETKKLKDEVTGAITTVKHLIRAKICGLDRGDSGSPVYRLGSAQGVLSANSRRRVLGVVPNCSVYYTPLKAKGLGAESATGATVITSTESGARPAAARLPTIGVVEANPDGPLIQFGGYQNQPKFFVRSRGLPTTAHFERQIGWGGSVAQVFPDEQISVPGSSTNYEIPHDYADCVISSDTIKIRLIATNESGSTQSAWYRLNENCLPG